MDVHLICTDKDRSVRREFNRQIDIPQNVDPKSLRSTLSKDGILQVHRLLCSLRDGLLKCVAKCLAVGYIFNFL